MSEKPRIIGLDIGDRRIGIAISDPLGITAAGLETIERTNTREDVSRVKGIARRHGAVQIVVGLPLNMDGSSGDQAEKVRSFASKLARATGLPVVYEDERLSTVGAIRTLTIQGVKTGNKKALVDMQAAAIILQRYLDGETPRPSA
ncbi:MAG: Holliday junction resolvase RuvX [Candidatus Melainabacteria bacterium]|nr:Holliday junction resolvase RuvX [Candidatus Melainabacteria bacterium]